MQDKTGILEVNMKNILIVTGHTYAKDSIGMFNTGNSTPKEKLSMEKLAKKHCENLVNLIDSVL